MSCYRIPRISGAKYPRTEPRREPRTDERVLLGMSTAKRAKRINTTAILTPHIPVETIDLEVPSAEDWDQWLPTSTIQPAVHSAPSTSKNPKPAIVEPRTAREPKKPIDLPPERPIPTTASSSKPNTLSVTRNPFVSCYLICQEEKVKIMNKVGHIKYQIIEKSDYIKGEVTYGDVCKFAKVTLMAQTEQLMEEAIAKLRMKVKLRPIAVQHCTICYKDDHPTFSCMNCSYCTERGHLARDCPEKARLVKDCPETERRNPENERSTACSSGAKAKINYFLGSNEVWYRKAGLDLGIATAAKVLGDPPKRTFGLDVEKVDTIHGQKAANVCISGYFGGKARYKVVYFTFIRQEGIRTTCEFVSGIQLQDVEIGKEKEIVKEELLSLLKDTRVITHSGNHDFTSLEISQNELELNKIEHVDLAEMFRDEKGVIKLTKLVSFFVTNSKGIQAGIHNPEVDARNTLVIYNKWTKLSPEIQKELRKNSSVIRRYAESGRNIENNLGDCGQSSTKRGEL